MIIGKWSRELLEDGQVKYQYATKWDLFYWGSMIALAILTGLQIFPMWSWLFMVSPIVMPKAKLLYCTTLACIIVVACYGLCSWWMLAMFLAPHHLQLNFSRAWSVTYGGYDPGWETAKPAVNNARAEDGMMRLNTAPMSRQEVAMQRLLSRRW